MAPDDPTAPGRKADHLRIAAEPGIEHAGGSGLDERAPAPPRAARARPRRGQPALRRCSAPGWARRC